jgi:hypothetical protein
MSDVFNVGVDPLSYSGLAVTPPSIISTRAPNSTDINYPLGQIWINKSAGSAYILTQNSNGTATWNLLGAGATGAIIGITGDAGGQEVPDGGGNFNILGTANQVTTTGSANTETLSLSSTLVAPGSITSTTGITAGTTLTSAGATTLATTGSSVNTFGNATGTTSVTVTSGSGGIALTATNATLALASGTGALNISNDAAATTVRLGTGAAAKTVIVGSTNTTSTTTINAGSGGIVIVPTAGNISVAPSTSTTASPTAAVTANVRLGCATFTGFTTASSGTQAFTITNSNVLTTSAVQVTVTNLNASTNGAQMGIAGVTQAAGSLIVHTINNGSGALGTGDNVLINFWVMS